MARPTWAHPPLKCKPRRRRGRGAYYTGRVSRGPAAEPGGPCTAPEGAPATLWRRDADGGEDRHRRALGEGHVRRSPAREEGPLRPIDRGEVQVDTGRR